MRMQLGNNALQQMKREPGSFTGKTAPSLGPVRKISTHTELSLISLLNYVYVSDRDIHHKIAA